MMFAIFYIIFFMKNIFFLSPRFLENKYHGVHKNHIFIEEVLWRSLCKLRAVLLKALTDHLGGGSRV
jgi:hypothetical protein